MQRPQLCIYRKAGDGMPESQKCYRLITSIWCLALAYNYEPRYTHAKLPQFMYRYWSWVLNFLIARSVGQRFIFQDGEPKFHLSFSPEYREPSRVTCPVSGPDPFSWLASADLAMYPEFLGGQHKPALDERGHNPQRALCHFRQHPNLWVVSESFEKTSTLTYLSINFPIQSALPDHPEAVVLSRSVLRKIDTLRETASITHRYSNPITTAYCDGLDAKSLWMACVLSTQTSKWNAKTDCLSKAPS